MCMTMTSSWGDLSKPSNIFSTPTMHLCTHGLSPYGAIRVWRSTSSQKRVFVLSLTVFVAVQTIIFENLFELDEEFSCAFKEKRVRFWLSINYLLISFKMVVKHFIRTSNKHNNLCPINSSWSKVIYVNYDSNTYSIPNKSYKHFYAMFLDLNEGN